MLPYTRILCPTDFSEPSFAALKAANELALHFDSALYVVHVVPFVPVTPSLTFMQPVMASIEEKGAEYKMALVKHSEEALDAALKDRTGERVGLYPVIKYGEVDEQILTLVQEKEIDLVVMGTRGQTGIKRLVFGSVAEKVVSRASCPVMVVPFNEDENE